MNQTPNLPLRVEFAPTLPVTTRLRTGCRGAEVKDLQRLLRAVGYKLAVDGYFGPITECCVRSFQATRNLIRDGAAGPHTWAALGGAIYA